MKKQSGVFMPTAEERAKYFRDSDIIKARFGFVTGDFEENGKKMRGALGYLTNEYGEIEWDYTTWEADPAIDVLTPIVEVATYQAVGENDYLIDVVNA